LSWLARFGFGTCAEWGNSHAGSALGIPAFKSQPGSVSVQTSHLNFLKLFESYKLIKSVEISQQLL